MAATAEPLTRADAAWLHAETATNPFVVTSLAILERPVDPDRFVAMLSRRLALHPRLRQIVREPLLPGSTPEWVEASDFDIRAHVHPEGLPAPGGRAELAAFVSDLIGQPLDFHRPFWQVYLVDGPGDHGAVVSRFHHSLGDGQAMVKMLLTLTDRTAGGWRRRVAAQRTRARRTLSLAGVVGNALGLAVRAPELPHLLREGAALGVTLARLTVMDEDPPTPFRGRLTMLKRIAWSRPLELELVKRTAHRDGCTVNDVLVSAVAGSLGTYLGKAGVDTGGMRVRAMVPVNLRPAGDSGMTENRFSLVYLELPVGIADARERLERVRREMDRIKASQEVEAGWVMLRSLGLVPPRLEQAASRFYADKASLVLTNVIGPGHPLYVCGSEISEMTFWEPESGGLGLGISIFSYAGRVVIGVIADVNLVPDPEAISAGFEEAFQELAAAPAAR